MVCNSSSRLMMEFWDPLLKFSFKVINLYRPYSERISFWDSLAHSGVFLGDNVVLGGDLNFTVSSKEIWGGKPDETTPLKILQTWRNGRKGKDLIAKRLDHFLVSEKLVNKEWGFSFGIVEGGCFDHIPIVLRIVKQDKAKVFSV
jgi:hypothetical protein